MPIPQTDRYAEAKALVFGSGKVSFTFIQRTMGLGHHTAVQFIERMEAEEFVSRPTPAGIRKVLARDLQHDEPEGLI